MSDKDREKPCLRVTKNYDLFVQSKDNRPTDLGKRVGLVESMKTHGFIPSYPISVVRCNGTKLEIRDGQHRFAAAQSLGLNVWYIIDDKEYDIAYLNGRAGGVKWNPRDYAQCYANQGYEDYSELITFADEFHLPITTAAALLANRSPSGENTRVLFGGEFKIKNRDRARRVAMVYARMCSLSKHVRNVRLIHAIYACTYVEGFDIQRIIDRVEKCADKLLSFSTSAAYIDMIEDIYNYGMKNRVPIKIPAQNAMRERNPSIAKSDRSQ